MSIKAQINKTKIDAKLKQESISPKVTQEIIDSKPVQQSVNSKVVSNQIKVKVADVLNQPAKWGMITGEITDQEDLQIELSAKANTGDLTSHVNDTDNPHAVTAEQVGALTEETDPVWESEKDDYQKANITDTKANILALTPTAGLVAYATDTEELLFADGSNWKNHLHTQYLETTAADTTYLKLDASNSPSVSISRDINGVIDEWTVDGVTYTPTYTTELMTSYTDGTSTWTISRDGNNLITGVTKS